MNLDLIRFLLLIVILATLDALPYLVIKMRNLTPIKLSKKRNYDYTILVSIFKKPIYLENLELLKKYKKHVLVLTTNRETPEFYKRLNYFCKKYGFRSVRIQYGPDYVHPKSAMAIFVRGLRHVKTEYVIRMDADSIPKTHFSYLFATLKEQDLDIASVRVLPLPEQKYGNVIEKLQSLEYESSMDNRTLFPFLTSGAAIVGKTELLKKINDSHSTADAGEDIEIGKLAGMHDAKIGHIDFTVYTEVPRTFKQWFKQRVYWMSGDFRHSVMNFWTNTPWNLFYFTFIVWGLLPFRIIFTIQYWYLIPLIQALYIFADVFIKWDQTDPYYILAPIYSFLQSTVIPIFAVWEYFATAKKTNTWGIIKLRGKHAKKSKITFVWPKLDFSFLKTA